MPSRRDLIAMTSEEVRAYLLSQPRMIVVSNGVGGFPHPVPMNFTLDEEGRILITTFARSQKVVNLERDPRASLLVESGEVYEELKSVILYAEAEILRDPEAVRAGHALMAAKAQTQVEQSDGKQAQVRASLAKRVIIRFTPERVISWDHAKLGAFY
ncbi:MAG TPA: pyridoxamine 5'-phosphate oxidase family protein [Sphingobium sp.]|uniref:pyridoxamine 5'-phosphate oxidase family protein n=1 Tax=Sphingobium sp. TaxID=1912891 RepID=UPI002ED37883